MESKENNESPPEDEILKSETIEPVQFIKDLDISHDDKLRLTGAISVFITECANEKAKVAMFSTLGLDPADEKFVALWNDVSPMICYNYNEIFHELVELFGLEQDEKVNFVKVEEDDD